MEGPLRRPWTRAWITLHHASLQASSPLKHTGLRTGKCPKSPTRIREEAFESTPGCLELFTALDAKRFEYDPKDFHANRQRALKDLEYLDFESYLLPTSIPGLDFIKAGRMDADYARRVGEFHWDRLFHSTVGLFHGFADFLRQRFKYVLVDSRTGMSDTSGICTMLLPDKLVVVFTPNQQSLTGIEELVRKAVGYRRASPDGRPLTVFPLPSRIETTRPQLSEAWRLGWTKSSNPNLPSDFVGYQPLFERLFDEIYSRSRTQLTEYFDAVVLQHVPDYAYGEPVPVMLEETDSRISLRSSYSAFAERISDLQAPWESTAEVRHARETRDQCSQAVTKADIGDIEGALLLAYGLIDRKHPPALFESVVDAVLAVSRAAYPRARKRVSQLLHGLSQSFGERSEIDPTLLAAMLVDAGDASLAAGDYRLSKELFAKGCKQFSEAFGAEHPATISAKNKLAESLSALGQTAEAEQISARVLEESRHARGQEDPSTLISMSNLAETLRAQGDLNRARSLQEQVLEAYRGMLGEEHPDTLRSMNNLANTLRAQGDLPGARSLHERALEVSRRVLGEEDPNTLASMNGLANTLRAQGDLPGARSLQERVLEVSRRVLGEEHPNTLASINNLALTLQAQGNLPGARTLQERALEVSRRVLGEEHPDTLGSMSNLALTLQAQGDLRGARSLHERALEGRRRVLGEEHPGTLASMNNLANTLRAQGDLAGARRLHERVLEVRRRVLGEEHPKTLASMNNLANTLRTQPDLPGARSLQERLLEVSRRVLGEEHPNTLTSMGNLALTLGAQGDLIGARSLQERVLEISRRVLGEEHSDTLTSMSNLAETLRAQGDLPGARTLQERVLKTRRRVLGEVHPDTRRSMNNLAHTLQAQGDLTGARTLQERALEVSRRDLGEEQRDI